MTFRRLAVWVTIVWSAMGVLPVVRAQNEPPRRGYSQLLDNIDFLIENYSRYLVRKYSLTPEQDQFTQQLLKHKAHEFLDKHDREIRELVDRLFDVRTGGEMSQEELVDWGRRINPIYNEAKKFIVEGNAEWREILTPEQQRIHDEDLRLMHQSFQVTDRQIERIVTGQMSVDEFRNPMRYRQSAPSEPAPAAQAPPPQPGDAGGPTPPDAPPVSADSQPPTASPASGTVAAQANSTAGGDSLTAAAGQPEGQVAHPAGAGDVMPDGAPVPPPPQVYYPPPAEPAAPVEPGAPKRPAKNPALLGGVDYESQWEAYVRQFIDKYKLNEEQKQRAETILKECKDQAERHVTGKKSELEQIDRRIQELARSSDPKRAEQIGELAKRRAKLLDPINQIFERQLKPRLERLPTRAQRQAAESAAKKAPPAPQPSSGGEKKSKK